MIAGYELPRDWTHAISAGSFATDPAALQDRKPGERCMLVWPDGAQTVGTTQQITFTRAAPFVPRLAALLGSDLPVGLRVTLHGKRAADSNFDYALGGNSLTQTITQLPSGTNGCIWVLDDALDPVIGGAVTLYNDVAASTAILAEAEHVIGELVMCPAVQIPHEAGPTIRWVISGPEHRGPGGQLDVGAGVAYRTMQLRPRIQNVGVAWCGGLGEGLDWMTLTGYWSRDSFTLCVPYWSTPDEAQKTGIFGVIRGLGIEGRAGSYKQLDRMTFDEVPG